MFGGKASAEAESCASYKKQLGETASVGDGDFLLSNHPDDFCETILNAIAVCKSISHNPQEILNELNKDGPVHSLVYASGLHRSTDDNKPLPWIVAATAEQCEQKKVGEGAKIYRTWFVSFSVANSFEIAFDNIQSEGEFLDVGYRGHEDSQSGFDPSFVIPWLGEDSSHRVVFCGYSLCGGIIAQIEFNRVLRHTSIQGHRLLENGRLKCITFGCPLIGQAHFARRNKAAFSVPSRPFMNFLHENDLLPSLIASAVNAAICPDSEYDHRPLLRRIDTAITSKSPPSPSVMRALSGDRQRESCKTVPPIPLKSFSKRLPRSSPYVCAIGCIFRIEEKERRPRVVWCTADQVGQVYGPVVGDLSAEQQRLLQSRSFEDHYAQPLLRCLGHCFTGDDGMRESGCTSTGSFLSRTLSRLSMSRSSFSAATGPVTVSGRMSQRGIFDDLLPPGGVLLRSEPRLIAPEIVVSMCDVVKCKSSIVVIIGGPYVHWLQEARIDGMYSSGVKVTPVMKLRSTASPPVEVCRFTVDVSSEDLIDNAHNEFVVRFYGVIGSPVEWRSGRTVDEIPVKSDGMLTEEKALHKDGRFTLLEPATVIDIAVLRMAFLMRAVAKTDQLKEILKGVHDPLACESAYDLLSRSHVDDNLILWLRHCEYILLSLLHSAHTSILLDAPEVLTDLVTCEKVGSVTQRLGPAADSNAERLKRERLRDIADSLIDTGIHIPSDDRCNNQMSHLTPSLRLQHQVARLRLLYLSSRDRNDPALIDLQSHLTKFTDKPRLANNLREYFSTCITLPLEANMHTKSFDATKLMSTLTMECLIEGVKQDDDRTKKSISRSVIGVRALARTPFEDNTLVVQVPHGRWLKSAAAGAKLAALTVGSILLFNPAIGAIGMAAIAASKSGHVVDDVHSILYGTEADFTIETEMVFDALSKIDPKNSLTPEKKIVALQTMLLSSLVDPIENSSESVFKSRYFAVETIKRAAARFQSARASFDKIIRKCSTYEETLTILVEAIRSHTTGGRSSCLIGAGDMFSLECQLHKRVAGLGKLPDICSYDPSLTTGPRLPPADILADGVSTETWPCFVKLVRASLQIHDLRLHLGSTYVICIAGTRGAGKSTLVKNVFGVDNVQCGAADGDSTTDVQSYYIPVTAHGAIKHLLLLDLPGSDDVNAHSSLFAAEGFAVADLVIMVNKQERAATSGSVNVLKSLIHSIGGIDDAIPGKAKVRSWVDESEWDDAPVERSDQTRQMRKSVCKLVFLFTKADEHLANIARDASATETRTSRAVSLDAVDGVRSEGVRSDGVRSDGAAARGRASSAWNQLCDSCVENMNGIRMDLNVDKIAVATVCAISEPSDCPKGVNKDIVEKSIRAGAILDISGIVEFLARVVPLEVGDTLRARQVDREARLRDLEREWAMQEEGVEYDDDDVGAKPTGASVLSSPSTASLLSSSASSSSTAATTAPSPFSSSWSESCRPLCSHEDEATSIDAASETTAPRPPSSAKPLQSQSRVPPVPPVPSLESHTRVPPVPPVPTLQSHTREPHAPLIPAAALVSLLVTSKDALAKGVHPETSPRSVSVGDVGCDSTGGRCTDTDALGVLGPKAGVGEVVSGQDFDSGQTMPLTSLQANQVGSLLTSIGLGELSVSFEREQVDGGMLGDVDSMGDLVELGIPITAPQFSKLQLHCASWSVNGVPVSALIASVKG